MMQKLIKIMLFSMGALTLSGCDPDFYVSQAPVMTQFIGQSPERIYQQGEALLEARQYNRAISVFRAFIKLYPKDAQTEAAYFHLVECYAARGQFKTAILEIKQFVEMYPQSKYCAILKNKQREMERKRNMDFLYHLAWWKEIKKKNKSQYGILSKTLGRLNYLTKI